MPVACGRCLRNPSLSRLILADSHNSGGAQKAAALEAAAHKAAALEAAVLSRQSRARGVGGMRKAAVLEAAALEAAALEAVVPYVSVFKNTVVIVMLCVSRARTSHHIDLHFMRSRVIPESSSLVYTCMRRIPPPSSTPATDYR